MLPFPSEEVVQGRQMSMDQATVVLNTHVPTNDGLCGGCMELWGRWVPITGCTQLAWARSIMETHGVADDLWFVPSHSRYGTGARVAA
jgi:hypothetical protein